MTPRNRVTRLIRPDQLKQELNACIESFREQLRAPNTREFRGMFYGSAHGLLSALYIGGVIDQAEFQVRNAELNAEFIAGRI